MLTLSGLWEHKKMTEQNTTEQKSELIGGGFRVSVSIIGDRAQVVIDDITTTMNRGVTVIHMYHNDKYIRVGTDHIIRDIMKE